MSEIVIVGTGFAITANMIYATLIIATVAIIQPWSMTLRTLGVMIGLGAYGRSPFIIAGHL